jgi:hypothetical protein
VPLSTYLNDVATLPTNVATLPINASNVNYTKSDQTTVTLTIYINDVVNDIHTRINKINQMFPLSAANVNYTNEENGTKTVQTRLREIDDFDPTEVLKNISDTTENVNHTIENVKDITESVKDIATIAGTAAAVVALQRGLEEEIAVAAGVAAGAVLSIGALSTTVADLLPINATQVNYTKTDESSVVLDTSLQDIVSDIQPTSYHLSQSALNIEKINEINPLLGINEYYNESPPKKEKLFQYYKAWSTSQEKFTSIAVEVQINHDTYSGCLFRIDKPDNSIKIGNDHKR